VRGKRATKKEDAGADRAENNDGEAMSSIRAPRTREMDGWAEVLNDFGIKTLMAFVSFPRLRELFRNF